MGNNNFELRGGNALVLSGDGLEGDPAQTGIRAESVLNMNANLIKNLAVAVDDGDATRKDYVDARGYPYIVLPVVPDGDFYDIQPQMGYITNNGEGDSVVKFQMPSNSPVGAYFSIAGFGSAGWAIQFMPFQTVYLGTLKISEQSAVVESTNSSDCAVIVCVKSDNRSGVSYDTFAIVSSVGSLFISAGR